MWTSRFVFSRALSPIVLCRKTSPESASEATGDDVEVQVDVVVVARLVADAEHRRLPLHDVVVLEDGLDLFVEFLEGLLRLVLVREIAGDVAVVGRADGRVLRERAGPADGRVGLREVRAEEIPDLVTTLAEIDEFRVIGCKRFPLQNLL